jgi:hypothetical protein
MLLTRILTVRHTTRRATPSSDIEKDWRDKTGCTTINEYMEKGKYTVAPGTSFSKETQDTTLKTTWNQVTTEIKNSSWKAIYAKSDKKFDSIVAGMKKLSGHVTRLPEEKHWKMQLHGKI